MKRRCNINNQEKIKSISLTEDLSRFERFAELKDKYQKIESQRGNYERIQKVMEGMNKESREYLVQPRLLTKVFYEYLQETRPNNQQNKPLARSMTEVFSCLCHQHYISSKRFNMVNSFFMAKSTWDKFYIGRSEIKSGVAALKEFGLIIAYPFSIKWKANKKRKVTMYQINLEKMEELFLIIKNMAKVEKNERHSKYQAYLQEEQEFEFACYKEFGLEVPECDKLPFENRQLIDTYN